MTQYELSKRFWDWAFDNPEKITPYHISIYFFAMEHHNRLGQKEKFGFPSQMAMDAIGVSRYETYAKYFKDLCSWGFFTLIQKSQNQYSANIICFNFAPLSNSKALGKAIVKQTEKHRESKPKSDVVSNSSIDNINNLELITGVDDESKDYELHPKAFKYKNLDSYIKIHFGDIGHPDTHKESRNTTMKVYRLKDETQLRELATDFNTYLKGASKQNDYPTLESWQSHFFNWVKTQDTSTKPEPNRNINRAIGTADREFGGA